MAGDGNLEVVKTIRFGWCNDGHHDGCTARFAFYERDYQCSCECHLTKSLPPLVPGKNMSPVTPDKPERASRKSTPKK